MGSIGAFTDEFWNKEVGDFGGFDIIHQHIKEGIKVTHNYISLLKQVTSAMEIFGKSLMKAAKTSSLPEMEHGKLKNALQTARVSVEGWGQDTLDAASALSGQINFLNQHLSQAKDTRKRTDEEVKVQQNRLQDVVGRVKQAKRTAQNKLKDKMECETQRFVLDSKVDAKPKDVEKMAQADKRADDAVLDAERNHRETITKHNNILGEWRTTTTSSFTTMQDVEEARVKVVRDSLWTVANICSMLAVQCDQHQENIRMALISVDVGQELTSWVAINRTAQTPPVPLIYRAIQRPSHTSTPTATPATSTRSTVTEMDSSSTSQSRSTTATPEPIHDAIVDYEFIARSESEVSLRVGERVSVVNDSNGDWIFIRNRRGGEGFVPASFIRAVPR